MDFSGVTIFRHTITMIVVVWRFLYCDEILKVMREDMMNDTFMKEKPILPLLTSMALPMVVSMLVNSLYNIVDSLFVAKINEKAMTALSLVYPLQNLMNAIAIGFGIGINAVIAFHLGAGNREKADIAATHGFIFAWILCRIGGAEWVWHAFWISETITALIAWRIYHKSVKMN